MFAKLKITLSFALILGGALAGSALGQTTRTNPSASSTIPTIPSSSSTSTASPCYSSTNPTSPCYSATTNPSYSAVNPSYSPTATTPTVSNPRNPEAPVHSFTSDQAKSRIEAKGYSNVSGLQKDTDGAWRGKAIKDGNPVSVILDFQGNIVAN
jgi:hypothetical protein